MVNRIRNIFFILVLVISCSFVLAVDDSTAFISRGDSGNTLESYFMKALPKNLSNFQIYIKQYNIDVIDTNKIEINIQFRVNSEGLYPVIFGFDKNNINIESVYLNGNPIDLGKLVYNNFFFCNPEYDICEDKQIENNGIITFEGPKGINMRGYPIAFTFYPDNLYELRFILSNIRGNMGNEYPFENFYFEYSTYMPVKRTTINNLVVNLGEYNAEASFIQEQPDYKKSKLVDHKFTNKIHQDSVLKSHERSLVLNIQPSEELITYDYTLFRIRLSISNSNKYICILLITILITLIISSYIGFQFGSKQKGKEYVLLIIGSTFIYGVIFSLFIPFTFLVSKYIILTIVLAYLLNFIMLKMGSKLRKNGNKKI